MSTKRHISIPVLLLAVVAIWGVIKIYGISVPFPSLSNSMEEAEVTNRRQQPQHLMKVQDAPAVDKLAAEIRELQSLLANNLFAQAIARLDQLYPQLGITELDDLQSLFLRRADQLTVGGQLLQAQALLRLTAESYDDTNSWNALAHVAEIQKNWQLAFRAYLRASELEYRPEQLLDNIQSLVKVSSHLRSKLEKQGDWLAIKTLFQRLNDQHPGQARFQLELARAHLRLNDPAPAARLLELLQYDPDMGEIARQMLAGVQFVDPPITTDDDSEQINQPGEVVVPLIRAGDSFLADVLFGSNRLTMLLDTGASITALSQNAIQKLGLKPTGRFIQLHTANGMRRAQLFRAGRIRLGRLSISDFVVAEIEFDHTEKIQGLLGTDLLNQIDSRYSFVLDNQQNSLIFRKK